MKCNKSHSFISHYINELGVKVRKDFESHMNERLKCREDFEEIQKIHELLPNTKRFRAPYGFSKRVIANVNTGITESASSADAADAGYKCNRVL